MENGSSILAEKSTGICPNQKWEQETGFFPFQERMLRVIEPAAANMPCRFSSAITVFSTYSAQVLSVECQVLEMLLLKEGAKFMIKIVLFLTLSFHSISWSAGCYGPFERLGGKVLSIDGFEIYPEAQPRPFLGTTDDNIAASFRRGSNQVQDKPSQNTKETTVLSIDGFQVVPERPRPFLGTTDGDIVESIRRRGPQ